MAMTMTKNTPIIPDRVVEPARRDVADAHWLDTVGQIGAEVGTPLSSALERVTALATTGKIDRAGLRALREDIERARRVAMIGQQLARFASGRVRQSAEQVSVTQMLRDVLVQRGREAAAREIEIRQALRPADVVADATLLHALLQAVVDWSLDFATASIEFKLDIKAWPPYARLSCRVAHAGLDGAGDAARESNAVAIDSMAWRLVEQIACTMNLVVERAVAAQQTTLTLEFPSTATQEMEGVSVIELDQGFGLSENSRPLAGSHVLVVAGGREVRSLIKESIAHMGLLVDFVTSVAEAEAFCRDALPHAIVFESVLVCERLRRLLAGILAEMPDFAFIEIGAEGNALELSTHARDQRAHLGRDAILQSLPSALVFELSRTA